MAMIGHSLSVTNPRLVASGGDPLVALYGTGLGQIPFHLAPENAVLDGSGNVLSVPNPGGAGAAFGTTASGAGITRGDKLLSVASSAYLSLANPADLVGTRLFMVAALASDSSNMTFAGRDGPADAPEGQRSNLRYEPSAARIQKHRQTESGAWSSRNMPLLAPLDTALHLIEVETRTDGNIVLVDGVEQNRLPWGYPDYLVDRVFAGALTPYFTGQAGDVLSVITDGSAALDPVMQQVRQILAAKHGITLKDPLTGLYGTGLGQIPLHLAPEDAVLDGDGNVVSVPNRGGAGAAFDAAANTTGINIVDGRFDISYPNTNRRLGLPTTADLVGARLFVVAAFDPDAEQGLGFIGRSAGTEDGQRTVMRRHISGNITAHRHNGTAFSNVSAPLPLTGSDLHLFEVQIAGGFMQAWVDGVTGGPTAWPEDHVDFRVSQIFSGGAIPYFAGSAGDILSVITDGSAALDPVMLQVRQRLAAKHGITLA